MGNRGPKPGDSGYVVRPIKERILDNIIMDSNECWIWQGASKDGRYGSMTIGSRLDGTIASARVHRIAYVEWIGPIPNDMTVNHKCEVKKCCNPEHLELLTNGDNKRYSTDRMTHCRRGHERNEKNTYVKPDGKKQCRVCKREVAKR